MKKRMLFIAGNWKMNKSSSEAEKFLFEIKDRLAPFCDKLKLAVCPAFTALERSAKVLKGSNVSLGAQDLSAKERGAFTGEISAKMLLDIGVKYVIVGHSERREYHAETNSIVNAKAKKALSSGLIPIVCIGETLKEREANMTRDVITSQVMASFEGLTYDEVIKTVVAYEPIWAIGTGKTALPAQAQEVHALIRKLFAGLYGLEAAEKIIIQYGGSVKPDNSYELMNQQDIDGALVGGASLEVESFYNLVANCVK